MHLDLALLKSRSIQTASQEAMCLTKTHHQMRLPQQKFFVLLRWPLTFKFDRFIELEILCILRLEGNIVIPQISLMGVRSSLVICN